MSSRRQRGGVAIMLLLAVLALGGTYYLVSGVNAMSAQRKAAVQTQNAAVLGRAKLALIGYVAAQANRSGEDDPGAMPCPEAPGYFASTTQDGQAAGSCTLPTVGRFPWRTIGTDKLIDATGEPLWYVVSPGWAKISSGTNTNINSNSVGQLTVDGSAGSDGSTVVALIIAPGQAINVIASAGCAAWTQTRPTSGIPDWRNYLECENATSPADATFVTTGPDGSFNDQVIRVTKADVMPVIEAAIANRIEREIAPVLKTMYTGTKWNASSTQTTFPFAATFANPSTSNYQGAAATPQGLLPFSYSPACSPAGDARCTSSSYHTWSATLTKTGGTGNLWAGFGPDCSESGGYVTCTGYYQNGSLTARFDDALSNMGNALRNYTASHTVQVWTILYDGWGWDGWQEVTGATTLNRQFNSNGSLSFRVSSIPLRWAWGTSYGYYYIYARRPEPSDHSLLNSSSTGAGATGWFVRNEWYRLTYYAIAPNHAPGGSLACSGVSCLSVTNLAGEHQALLILAGRSVNGSVRPSSAIGDYLDGTNASNNYNKQSVSSTSKYNDRFAIIRSN